MATTPSFVQINEGTGKKLAHATYTENGQVVYDQKVLLGEPYLATGSVIVGGVAVATAADHLLEIMAGASLNVRIRSIRIRQRAVGTAGTAEIQLLRLSTAGTGGTVVTPHPYDTADSLGATAMQQPTVKGTEGVELWRFYVPCVAAEPKTAVESEWHQTDPDKPFIIPAGTTNGLVFKNVAGIATDTITINVEFAETSF